MAFSDEEMMRICFMAALSSPDGKISEDDMTRVADKLWEMQIGGSMVELVLHGRAMVRLEETGELGFRAIGPNTHPDKYKHAMAAFKVINGSSSPTSKMRSITRTTPKRK